MHQDDDENVVLRAPPISPIPEATAAERPGMPAGRTIVHRTASTVGTAVEAGTTTAGDADGVGRRALVERSHRHGPRRGNRRKAETNGKRGCSKYFHRLFSFPSLHSPRCGGLCLGKKCDFDAATPLTSSGGASGGDASDGDASPNGDGANGAIAGASDDPSAPVPV
jgi:hypothetical protein